MKSAMKSYGDVYKEAQVKKAFAFKCNKCLDKCGVRVVDEQALCERCGTPMATGTPGHDRLCAERDASPDVDALFG